MKFIVPAVFIINRRHDLIIFFVCIFAPLYMTGDFNPLHNAQDLLTSLIYI